MCPVSIDLIDTAGTEATAATVLGAGADLQPAMSLSLITLALLTSPLPTVCDATDFAGGGDSDAFFRGGRPDGR